MAEEKQSMSRRIIYSGWDFQQALSALTFLLEECNFDEKYNKIQWRKFRCYETNLVVSFARPFKMGRGREILNLKEVDFEFTELENKLKEKIIHLRDKVVSHSDEEAMVFKVSSFKPFEDKEVRMPVEEFSETLHFSEEEYIEIEKLLHRITRAIAEYKFDYVQNNPDGFSELKVNTPNNSSKKDAASGASS